MRIRSTNTYWSNSDVWTGKVSDSVTSCLPVWGFHLRVRQRLVSAREDRLTFHGWSCIRAEIHDADVLCCHDQTLSARLM